MSEITIPWASGNLTLGRLVVARDLPEGEVLGYIANLVGVTCVMAGENTRPQRGDLWVGCSPAGGWAGLAGETGWARSGEAIVVVVKLTRAALATARAETLDACATACDKAATWRVTPEAQAMARELGRLIREGT